MAFSSRTIASGRLDSRARLYSGSNSVSGTPHSRLADTLLGIALPSSFQREFFEETARHRTLPCSALDFRWMEEIEGRSPVMFVAAGLLPYFPPDEVKRLVATLATRFPGSEMVFDTVSEWFSKLSLNEKAKIGEYI